MNLVSIITVNFNQFQVTIDFLKSVKAHAATENIEVILVDNGSGDDHGTDYLAEYPDLIYIRSELNLGFAGGNNLGVVQAKGDYLLFLNNDTEITADLIPGLVSVLETNPEIGLISPLILYFEEPEVVQYAGFTGMNYLTGRNKAIGYMEQDRGQYDQQSYETGYCHGAAMMCRARDLEVVGLMASQFFLYYEELDWCERFRQAGLKIWFYGGVKIYHKESMSVGKESNIKTYFMTRNRMLFIRRNTGFFNTVMFCIFFILVACPKQIIKYLKKGRKDLVKWVFRGVLWNLTHHRNSKDLGFEI